MPQLLDIVRRRADRDLPRMMEAVADGRGAGPQEDRIAGCRTAFCLGGRCAGERLDRERHDILAEQRDDALQRAAPSAASPSSQPRPHPSASTWARERRGRSPVSPRPAHRRWRGRASRRSAQTRTPSRSTRLSSLESPVLRRKPSSACGGSRGARALDLFAGAPSVASGSPRAISARRRGVAKVSIAFAFETGLGDLVREQPREICGAPCPACARGFPRRGARGGSRQ